MKIKKIALSIVALGVLSLPTFVSADDDEEQFSWLDRDTWSVDVSGEINGNYGVYTGRGATHNPKRHSDTTAIKHNGGDPYMSQVNAKLFLNQEVSDNTSWHAGLQLSHDWSEVDGYTSTRINSQFDWLRELYVDTSSSDNMSWRIGKQQVVWGKADGVKFLDIINPTDFRHWGQDSMEDSRIPLWMVTGEYAINDNSSLQVVFVPQVDVTNQIPGLYNTTTGDQGEPFVPLGMETMFGQKNGFMNIGPDLGNVANVFTNTFNGLLPGIANPNVLAGFTSLTVSGFTNFDGSNPNGGQPDVNDFLNSLPASYGYTDGSVPSGATGNQVLYGATYNNGSLGTQTYGAGATTNLMGISLNTSNPKSMFDYMGDTTFATFASFQSIKTKHVKERADNGAKGNIGIRYSGTNDDIGLNYTLNYYYHYDNNPVVNVGWQGSNGQALTAKPQDQSFNQQGQPVASNSVNKAYSTRTMVLMDGNNPYNNGASFLQNGSTHVANPATLVFTEKQHRINTIGGSFDYAIDNSFAPVIVRSEMVYDKDTLQPTVDLGKLAYGDVVGAFQNEKASFFNYVVGLDVTVMRNLFVSFQFMDKWNLDYKDGNSDWKGTKGDKSYGKFTANPASMSLSNGFRKAERHQIAYTLFLSKPFLEGETLRLNNLFLLENQRGGYWDRFNLEYTYSDSIVLTAAVNQYGGDRYGVFGQFQNESNAQVGFKFIF